MSLQSTDPVADLLTRIRNAIAVGTREIRLPASKQKETVARVLKAAGYLADVKVEKGQPRATLIITINQEGESVKISEISRVSKPGRRVYAGASEIPKVKSGRGLYIVSTSKGVMTSREAINARIGGELICKVY
ncbi:MAG: 30S ribosomal protein S8 [Candidatus Nomurabacteria bacterium]|jgi:small subunit ribosomal protein S8|nr:30S ribosomal protein S8 [Candidatus Nomurabacteria bacterium]